MRQVTKCHRINKYKEWEYTKMKMEFEDLQEELLNIQSIKVQIRKAILIICKFGRTPFTLSLSYELIWGPGKICCLFSVKTLLNLVDTIVREAENDLQPKLYPTTSSLSIESRVLALVDLLNTIEMVPKFNGINEIPYWYPFCGTSTYIRFLYTLYMYRFFVNEGVLSQVHYIVAISAASIF